ncbi:endoribonuclease MazF [Patescibacteria group bacterium]|jgi:mRNA interferase MazF|nr:endoribonuclease MazF [Patescibacteria group bacterium]
MVARRVPDRGDVVWVDLNPTRGHEQARVRPALVLSPRSYNRKTSLILACPITSHAKGYPFEVPISVQKEKIEGVVLVDQVRSLDWRERNVRYAGKATDDVLDEVTGKLTTLISW